MMGVSRRAGAAAAVVLLLATLLRRQRRGGGAKQRRVRVLPRGRPLAAGPHELSVVSYNILCQRFATTRRLPHAFGSYLEWEYRWARLQRELASFAADVVCLQELTLDRWPEVKEFMAVLGYAALVQVKPATVSGADFALATFYRAAKLRVVWQEERSRALLAGFEVTAAGPAAGRVVWVVNLHLEGSPYRPNDRVSQLKSTLQRLQAQHGGSEEAEAADVVICGDFNSGCTDSPCWFLRRGRLDRNFTDALCPQVPVTKVSIAHPYALQEAYEAAKAVPPFTRKANATNAIIDFLWCSRHLEVAAVMRPLQREHRELVAQQFCPNRVHPSDHLPIGAVIRLAPESSCCKEPS